VAEERFAAVVLAGGAGRRLGGARKPLLPVGGRPMLARVLDAVAAATPRVVVGPPTLVAASFVLPPGVLHTSEEPPGTGPVAGLAAGLALVPGTVPVVAVLAADLPFLTAADLEPLWPAPGTDGTVYLDWDGREQWLCGMWSAAALRDRLAALDGTAGRSLRELMAGLRVAGVAAAVATASRPPPWYDCDSEEHLRVAESGPLAGGAERSSRSSGPNLAESGPLAGGAERSSRSSGPNLAESEWSG
jgi:molybdenum cofactor guanylyltransferase